MLGFTIGEPVFIFWSIDWKMIEKWFLFALWCKIWIDSTVSFIVVKIIWSKIHQKRQLKSIESSSSISHHNRWTWFISIITSLQIYRKLIQISNWYTSNNGNVVYWLAWMNYGWIEWANTWHPSKCITKASIRSIRIVLAERHSECCSIVVCPVHRTAPSSRNLGKYVPYD